MNDFQPYRMPADAIFGVSPSEVPEGNHIRRTYADGSADVLKSVDGMWEVVDHIPSNPDLADIEIGRLRIGGPGDWYSRITMTWQVWDVLHLRDGDEPKWRQNNRTPLGNAAVKERVSRQQFIPARPGSFRHIRTG